MGGGARGGFRPKMYKSEMDLWDFTGDGSELGLGPLGCQEVGDEVVGRWWPEVVRRRRWSESNAAA